MGRKWTEDESLLALGLYLQTPYGQIHSHNPSILMLAQHLDRTVGSVAMKMLNFASLHPELVASGRKGLSHASSLDRWVWQQCEQKAWVPFLNVSDNLDAIFNVRPSSQGFHEARHEYDYQPRTGPTVTESLVNQRRGQNFFRQAVLANFNTKCCITGIAQAELLIASHIVPWKDDVENRLNPANGLALAATFDRAFDQGLITIDKRLCVVVGERLLRHENETTRAYFEPYHGREISQPERFLPKDKFIQHHNEYFKLENSNFNRSEFSLISM
jgi:putative restriction endonuclease